MRRSEFMRFFAFDYFMENVDQHLDQFEKDGFFIWQHFLSEETIQGLHGHIEQLLEAESLKKAGIGRLDQFKVDTSQRGDFIQWIDPQLAEPYTATYLGKINELIGIINRSFYLGIRDFECHYTFYPAGTFYRRHADRHQSGSSRIVSFVLYLNENWQTADGGILRIYNSENEFTEVTPQSGTLVVFLSEKEHEVMVTNKPRMSITGWMLNDKRL